LKKRRVDELVEIIRIYDSENPKLMKPKPDEALLAMVLDACKRFDMDDLDAAMDEIGQYQYDSDGGLTDWLRETVNNMELSKVVEKLAYLEDEAK
jgi:hypothetical protein